MSTLAAVAALIALGLTGCTPRAGAAALIGSHRITDSDVSAYVRPGATPTDSSGQTLVQRDVVLTTLVQDVLLRRALAEVPDKTTGSTTVTPSELATARATVLSSQQQTEASFATLVTGAGFRGSFADLDLNAGAMYQILAVRIGATQQSDVTKAVQKYNPSVRVSPRYGSWDAGTESLIDTGGRPSFIAFPSISTTAQTS